MRKDECERYGVDFGLGVDEMKEHYAYYLKKVKNFNEAIEQGYGYVFILERRFKKNLMLVPKLKLQVIE